MNYIWFISSFPTCLAKVGIEQNILKVVYISLDFRIRHKINLLHNSNYDCVITSKPTIDYWNTYRKSSACHNRDHFDLNGIFWYYWFELPTNWRRRKATKMESNPENNIFEKTNNIILFSFASSSVSWQL